MSEDHIRVVSGVGLLPSAVLRSYIDDILQGCEIDTRVLVQDDPIPTPHVPTEIELWNAAIDARKAAKRKSS